MQSRFSFDSIICRFGYELPESGRFRAGFADIDGSTALLSLVGSFEGLYTFDISSGKKKKRPFQGQGSCIYSNAIGSLIGSMHFLKRVV